MTTGGSRLFDWPFQQSSTLLVQGWGFWLGVVGFPLGLAGFGVTIWQLRATRRVTEQVRDELDRVRSAVRTYDAYQETAKAQLALQSARKSLMRRDWEELAINYSTYLSAIHVIKELDIRDLIPYLDKMNNQLNMQSAFASA
jgi:hypothetical protein